MKKILLALALLWAVPALGQSITGGAGSGGGGGGGGGGVTINTTTITGGGTGRLLYDNAGTVGEITGWTSNGTTGLTGAASSTLAIGGATIGTDALAVTGTAAFSDMGTFGAASAQFRISDGGALITRYNNSTRNGYLQMGLSTFILANENTGNNIKLSTTSSGQIQITTGTANVYMAADAENVASLRDGVNAQTFNVYNTFTDVSNYERGTLNWATNVFTISTAGAGTGATNRALNVRSGGQLTLEGTQGGPVYVGTNGTLRWYFDGAAGHFLANADNTYDIGAINGTSPRAIYSATSVVTAGYGMFGSRTALTLTAGAIGMQKITASASAPGAAGSKFEVVCGTNAGTAKLVMYAGTSGTAVTVVDSVGAGVTGC